jgi:hypothetical protein
VTTCDAPVVTVTLRGPGLAAAAMLICAVSAVALTTVMFATVMPAPKDTCVVPWANEVLEPLMVIPSD